MKIERSEGMISFNFEESDIYCFSTFSMVGEKSLLGLIKRFQEYILSDQILPQLTMEEKEGILAELISKGKT